MAFKISGNALDFIPTIEDDQDVQKEDSDSEEEVVAASKRPKHKSSAFTEGFEFSETAGSDWRVDVDWSVDEDILAMAKKKQRPVFTSLDAKIARAKEIRKLKAEEKREDDGGLTEDSSGEDSSLEEEESHVNGDAGDDVGGSGEAGDAGDTGEAGDSDGASDSDDHGDPNKGDEERDDTLKVKKTRHQKSSFFEEPPIQKVDVNFTDMSISRPLLKAITSIGYSSPTPIQANAVPLALMGKDICACAATGTGKTAAFMLPILERLLFRPTRTRVSRVLILTPTRELAMQVHSVGKALSKHMSVDFCLVAGGLESKSQVAMLRKNPDVVIATPGRLVDHLHNAPSFTLSTIEILVLDEADRMLDEHFEEQMNDIIKQCPKNRQTMLFSATMTDQVEELVRLSLNHPVRLFVDSNTDVAENLQQEFIRIKPKKEEDREAIVTALCSRTFKDHCLVFFPTKKLAHRMRIIFGLLGLNATELHGNLSMLQRIDALRLFKEGSVDFLLVTDLASRGLDIERVKTVINFNMPATCKQYIHRVGRTARAGRSGRSVTLVGEKGRRVLKDVVKRAKQPVKSRVIPPEVVVKYRERIRLLQSEMKVILKQEEEEKQMRVSEMEMNKARNMIEHEEEIFSRPAKTWIQSSSQTAGVEGGRGKKASKKEKRKKPETPEEKEALRVRLEQEYAARKAKRARKRKRLPATESNDIKRPKRGKIKPQPVIKAFDKELTDTSHKAVKGFRKSAIDVPKVSKGSGFKSKKKYKRR